VVSLRKEVLNFRQLEEESLGTLWDCFNELIITVPDLAIQDPILLQHFYMGLSKDSMESLDAASRGAFLHLSVSEARSMLDRISGKTPCTSIHNELLEEEKKPSPDQVEEVLIAKSQPLCLHQNLEEESQKLERSQDHVSKGSIACRSKPADSDAALESAFSDSASR
jgi:hypothetical protein